MLVRLKFSKQGQVKFVGHLDTLRLFQRAIKVADLPVAYSLGFNPHSLVYFALPLSVGVSSTGEYMDIMTKEDVDVSQVKNALNHVLTENIRILDAFLPEDKTPSLMSLVHAADYKITIPLAYFPSLDKKGLEEKVSQEQILINKKTKKGLKQIDIKPMIISYKITEKDEELSVNIKVHAGSKSNLNPELFLEEITAENLNDKLYYIERQELYTYDQDQWIPLWKYRRKQ